jgi:hypothetical protein
MEESGEPLMRVPDCLQNTITYAISNVNCMHYNYGCVYIHQSKQHSVKFKTSVCATGVFHIVEKAFSVSRS